MSEIRVRKGQGDVKLSRAEFERRLRERFYDPAFERIAAEIDRIVDVAWETYDTYRKSPRTRPAGSFRLSCTATPRVPTPCVDR